MSALQERFDRAVAQLRRDCEADPMVLALVVAGSMANDRVWEKSDLDVVIVVQEGKWSQHPCILRYEGVYVHPITMTRSRFRAAFEGTIQSSFLHSFLTKGRLEFSRDPGLTELWDGRLEFGNRDRAARILTIAAEMTMIMAKAEKWLIAKRDPEYSALWLLRCLESLAALVVTQAGEITGREVIAQAMRYEPVLFRELYTEFISAPKTTDTVGRALEQLTGYFRDHAPEWFAPLLDYLDEQPGAVGARELENYFVRHWSAPGVSACAEYLASEGMILAVELPARLTEKSRADVQEAAFLRGRR